MNEVKKEIRELAVGQVWVSKDTQNTWEALKGQIYRIVARPTLFGKPIKGFLVKHYYTKQSYEEGMEANIFVIKSVDELNDFSLDVAATLKSMNDLADKGKL